MLDIISVDDVVHSVKPDPDVYRYFMRHTENTAEKSWLLSSNPFAVTGVQSVGMQAIWVQRSTNAVFDPWEHRPTAIASSLQEIATVAKPV